ncbi:hypothetical protein SUGI_0090380 [Cryptomeria japonica]|nr:hypothetical protein SUGI_0090380 [Cryptomeria japonica]
MGLSCNRVRAFPFHLCLTLCLRVAYLSGAHLQLICLCWSFIESRFKGIIIHSFFFVVPSKSGWDEAAQGCGIWLYTCQLHFLKSL